MDGINESPTTVAQPPAQQPPAQQQMPVESTPATGTIPTQPAPDMAIPARPAKRGGLGGIVDELRDALTGGEGGWGRVAAEALTGAAAGASVRGRGTAGQAAFAGVQQGEHMEQMREQQQERQRQQQQQDMQNERQAKLDQFNFVKLQHDIAAGDFELAQRKVEAAEHETQFSQQQQDRQITMGSVDLGSYKDPADFTRVQEQDPEFWKNAYGMRVVTIPDIGENGERQGIRVFLQKADAGNQMAPKDATLWVFNPPSEGEKPKLEPHTVSVPMTNNELTARNAAMYKQYQDFVKTQADAADKASQQNLRDEQAKTQKTERTKNLAEANKANAEAAKAEHEDADTVENVDAIGTGHVAPDRLGYLLSRNPGLIAAVTKKYPDWDSSKAQAYPKVYQEFTSTKPGTAGFAINAADTALQHLQQLRGMNTVQSHIPGTPEWNAYRNQVDIVAPELAKFYGDTTIPAIEGYKKTLSAPLPGNRQSAIDNQVRALGTKLDSYHNSWRNAAPSAVYEKPMPGISANGIKAHAALDPQFAARVRPVYAGDGKTLTGYLVDNQYTPVDK